MELELLDVDLLYLRDSVPYSVHHTPKSKTDYEITTEIRPLQLFVRFVVARSKAAF